MNIENKHWGIKERIFESDYVLIDRLEIVEGGFSSKHKHWAQFNKFYIEEGVLKVTIETKKVIHEHILNEDNRDIIVPPGLIHKFLAFEPTICYEIIFIKFKYDDILRIAPENVGGILTKEQLEEIKNA